jgi:hypothetical protein
MTDEQIRQKINLLEWEKSKIENEIERLKDLLGEYPD